MNVYFAFLLFSSMVVFSWSLYVFGWRGGGRGSLSEWVGGERGRRANRGEGKERGVSLTGRLWCDGEGGDLFQSAVHHFGSSCGGVTYLLLSNILFYVLYLSHSYRAILWDERWEYELETFYTFMCVNISVINISLYTFYDPLCIHIHIYKFCIIHHLSPSFPPTRYE